MQKLRNNSRALVVAILLAFPCFFAGVSIVNAPGGSGSGYIDGSGVASGPITGNDTLEIRDGTDPQELRLYGTYTSSTNWEGLRIRYDSGAGVYKVLGAKGSAGGTARSVWFGTEHDTAVRVAIGDAQRWTFNPSSSNYAFGPLVDNQYDLGFSSLKLRTGYFGTSVVTPSVVHTDGGTKPTCDSSTRGKTWYDQGGAGVADTFEICMKDSGDAYGWKVIATP